MDDIPDGPLARRRFPLGLWVAGVVRLIRCRTADRMRRSVAPADAGLWTLPRDGRWAQDRLMHGEQHSRSPAQRCDHILALIDSVLSEHTFGATNTPPQQLRYAGVEGAAHVASRS
jgi:hypothetical protein